ncbi:MAG: protein kinase [Gemmatimonadales bacterium]
MPELLERIAAALKDRYAIERELGSGGMAMVYLADDLKHNRKVALKVLRPELTAALGAQRFLREIKIIARLQHPHILPLHDSGEAGGLLYYVMPYIGGPSLRDKLKEGPLPVTDTVRILRDVVDALAQAHKQGVVHRDIKPDNVLLSGRSAMVADFGVAKALSEASAHRDGRTDTIHGTTAGMALGTPTYMAPEQAAADPDIDHRADIYSVGVVGYELLTGRPPFWGMPPQQILAAHVTTPPEPLSLSREECPRPLQDLVMKCLAKLPSDRWQTADELLAAIESVATPSGGLTAITREVPSVKPGRQIRGLVALAGLVLVAVVGALIMRSRSGARLDSDLIAVAPFDVLDPSLELWREGLVDILSANLDGAGPLRTVPPTLAVNQWSGRADATSAARLGNQVGAGLIVFGRLLLSGADSVRLFATLMEVSTQTTIGQVELREDVTRIDRLADSLTILLLSDLSQRRQLGAIAFTSFGVSSPTALKAFLEAEQFYRQSQWDSARLLYGRAMQLDPNFALAYSRMGKVVGWRRGGEGSARFALQAGELNRGLAPRESLLVTADSIEAALVFFRGTEADWAAKDRLFPTLQQAIRLYPQDPGAWYQLGEARARWGSYFGATDQETLQPFSRAVELDSAFTPAYLYLVPLSLEIEGTASGRQAITAYLERNPPPILAAGTALASQLLGLSPVDSAALRAALDTLSPKVMVAAARTLARVPDTAEAAVLIARQLYHRQEHRAQRRLTWALAYRGHLAEARRLGDSTNVQLFAEFAMLGAVAHDTAARVFANWLATDHASGIYHALWWWVVERDTASMARAVRYWETSLASGSIPPDDLPIAEYAANTARAYQSLTVGDTAAALRRFEALPVWPWDDLYRERLMLGRLLTAVGRHDQAVAVLDQAPVPRAAMPRPGEIYWILERGKAHEASGNTAEAIRAYRFVTVIWHQADESLQPMVREARRRLQALFP